MNIRLNKEKSIGKVLFIVEGGKTEPYLLHRIFCNILDYQLETILRDKGYRKYNSKENATSQVFVINAEESNIKFIDRDNAYARQGMLLLSYPSIEAFTFSNFADDSYEQGFQTGDALKQYLHECKINQSHIDENTVKHAVQELVFALDKLESGELDVDAFGESNLQIFEWEEAQYEESKLYLALSLLGISLIDLGIIELD